MQKQKTPLEMRRDGRKYSRSEQHEVKLSNKLAVADSALRTLAKLPLVIRKTIMREANQCVKSNQLNSILTLGIMDYEISITKIPFNPHNTNKSNPTHNWSILSRYPSTFAESIPLDIDYPVEDDQDEWLNHYKVDSNSNRNYKPKLIVLLTIASDGISSLHLRALQSALEKRSVLSIVNYNPDWFKINQFLHQHVDVSVIVGSQEEWDLLHLLQYTKKLSLEADVNTMTLVSPQEHELRSSLIPKLGTLARS